VRGLRNDAFGMTTRQSWW